MLNFKQLYYFWYVARNGSIARTAEQLHLTPQTISGQLAEFERNLGVELFRRTARKFELTPAGEQTLLHAEEMFRIGEHLEFFLKYGGDLSEQPFRVGITDAVPRSLTYQLLAPVMRLPTPIRLICHEDKLDNLFAELAIQKLDLVIADQPLPTGMGVRGYNHELGRSSVSFCAAPDLISKFQTGFPESLKQAPMLLPGEKSAMQVLLERWFSKEGIQPKVIGKFDDSALMKAFGKAGAGIFPVPTVMTEEILAQYNTPILGVIPDSVVRYYAISVERRITHPAVLAVTKAAKEVLATEK